MHRARPHILDRHNFDADILRASPLRLCSYLPDRASQLTFFLLDVNQAIDPHLYQYLAHQGFRRSGNAFYRPKCRHCLQCIASRVVVAEFTPSRRYRKVLNRNAQLSVTLRDISHASHEHYNLYARYIVVRHADGDMYPPSLHTFEQFLLDSPAQTLMMECREPNGKLVAVAFTDVLADGLSGTYTFFDPSDAYRTRSLGVYCVLQQIETAQTLGLDYVYLGYFIPSVKKMRYKIDYTPIELLINERWLRFDDKPDGDDILKLLQTFPANSYL